MEKSKSTSKWSDVLHTLATQLQHEDVCLSTSAEAYAFIRSKWLHHLPSSTVQYHAVFLDYDCGVIGHYVLGCGAATDDLLDMRLLIVMTCLAHADTIIICHNHSTGMTEPTTCDAESSYRLQVAMGVVDSSLKDYIIVGEEGYFSFDDEGLIVT